MTAFTSFFVRSECWSVIFWINSDFVIILAMLFCPGFRFSNIAGFVPGNPKQARSAQLCFELAPWPLLLRPRPGLAARFARASRDRGGRCVAGFSNRAG